MKNLCLLKPGDVLSENLIWQWYSNISIEVADGLLNKDQRSYLFEYYVKAGLLRDWRQPFFRHHYARTFATALSFLFSVSQIRPTILDLGCGTGTQSIAFALLGAKVISLDKDKLALEVLRKRKDFYEQKTGRILDIQIWSSDVFTFDYSSIAPIDGLHSLFAFNMMQLSKKLISHIIPHMSKESGIAILDGNCSCWVPRLFPSRRRNALSPIEMEAELERYGFDTVGHDGGVVFQPVFWHCLPYGLLSKLDRWLGCQSWLFPISHQILAKRR